ncbi:MAG: hypothetical protein E7678_01615 [Ruminococcaceae bacterium]|nr:hypothetical protein [Oscillospiraceae bacterium]
MKNLTAIKIHVVSYFKNLSREKIAFFICIPIALVALCICAIMLFKTEKKYIDIPDEPIFVTEEATEKHTYSPNSPYSLEFESLGSGTCAVSSIGNFNERDLKIPQKSPQGEIIVEIKDNAFKGCSTIESITIPSSIERIGNEAFRGCSSLIYINVDMNNENFTSIDGVLFSKNKTRLICYPPQKSDVKYYLNSNVKTIDNYAFEGAKNITVILYSKSTSNFESISMGKGNDVLHTLPITCNYTGENSGK